MTMNVPAVRFSIPQIAKAREEAIDLARQASNTLTEAYELSALALEKAKAAHRGSGAHDVMNVKPREELFSRDFNAEKSLDAFKRQLDADIWTHLMQTTGMMSMMDHTAKEEFRKSLRGTEVPEATEENIGATLDSLVGDAKMIFQRGLAKAFIKLDKRFKSHDGFKIGSRMILDNLFDQWGGWNGYDGKDDMLADIERVFAVLDGEKPDFNSLRSAISASRKRHGAHQSETDAAYFKVRGFKNGNAHLWFTRDDLVEKANQMLRAYYGEVLPDAATVNEKPTGTAVSTKLQFYATPPAAVDHLLRNLSFKPGSTVLEPSAGEGAIMRRIPTDCVITAVEVHPVRAAYCGAICANFLTWKGPLDHFDYVLMNPPFSGTHWMDHVRKAFTHLAPKGTLRAILPASAEVNETRAHLEFRAWVDKTKGRYDRPWTSLPPESFASSGTNVQTVILEMTK